MNSKPYIVYCPRCKRRVASWDGKSTSNVVANCRKCNKRIVFHTDALEVEVKEIPERHCSSGVTFY